ncbi:MAG: hypothetical protein Q9224_006110, partial [Gallowayella concinna]
MAPVLNIVIQLLPSLPSAFKAPGQTRAIPNDQPSLIGVHDGQQQPIGLQHTQHPNGPKLHSDGVDHSDISTVAWGENRLDVFGLVENNLTHKYWDGHQWNPSGLDVETLGNGLATPPVAVSWGADRLDIFALDDHSVLKHQYWDGS